MEADSSHLFTEMQDIPAVVQNAELFHAPWLHLQ
jgi:hypothetical protein